MATKTTAEILTETVTLDLEIERMTGVWCDIGNDQLSDQQFRDALDRIREQLRRKRKQADQEGSSSSQTVSVSQGVA